MGPWRKNKQNSGVLNYYLTSNMEKQATPQLLKYNHSEFFKHSQRSLYHQPINIQVRKIFCDRDALPITVSERKLCQYNPLQWRIIKDWAYFTIQWKLNPTLLISCRKNLKSARKWASLCFDMHINLCSNEE